LMVIDVLPTRTIFGVEGEQVADLHRLLELEGIHRHRGHAAARMARGEDAAGDIDLRHDPAAENVAVVVGVGGHGQDPQHRFLAFGEFHWFSHGVEYYAEYSSRSSELARVIAPVNMWRAAWILGLRHSSEDGGRTAADGCAASTARLLMRSIALGVATSSMSASMPVRRQYISRYVRYRPDCSGRYADNALIASQFLLP